MQTITLQVQDSFIPNLLNFLNQFQDKVIIKKDKNLELDPFFYERQKQLQQDLKDIESGKSILISFEEFENNINDFEKELETKYANKD